MAQRKPDILCPIFVLLALLGAVESRKNDFFWLNELGRRRWDFIDFDNANPLAVAAGDFDSDGNQDILVSTDDSSIAVLYGDGFGNFDDYGDSFMYPNPNTLSLVSLKAQFIYDRKVRLL